VLFVGARARGVLQSLASQAHEPRKIAFPQGLHSVAIACPQQIQPARDGALRRHRTLLDGSADLLSRHYRGERSPLATRYCGTRRMVAWCKVTSWARHPLQGRCPNRGLGGRTIKLAHQNGLIREWRVLSPNPWRIGRRDEARKV